MPGAPVRIVTIFVSSPLYVAPDRGRVQAAAAKLTREYAGLVEFETVLWEEAAQERDRCEQRSS
jgi:hypothetical protein